MSDPLNVIALISGGKDSLFSLLHCIHHGHRIIALANLHPSGPSSQEGCTDGAAVEGIGEKPSDDIDSFMYQTVGYSVIPLYSEALGIPLYRCAITGMAVTTDRDYSYAKNRDDALDEIENLVPLLKSVMAAHPEANAISTGAIQSTYQRTRIESVALRLGLTPLAYLWQYPVLPPSIHRQDSRTGLLEDMAAAGCDARIIKIASGGISERLLWSDVASTRTMQSLVKGLLPFFHQDEIGLRGAIIGEGGEFETLALSGPRTLWKNGMISVDIDSHQPVSIDGGTTYACIGRATLVKYDDPNPNSCDVTTADLVRTPTFFDKAFETTRKSVSVRSGGMWQPRSVGAAVAKQIVPIVSADQTQYRLSYMNNARVLQVANITWPSLQASIEDTPVKSPIGQMKAIASHIPEILKTVSSGNGIRSPATTASIVHATLLLRSMDDFVLINPIYASMFEQGIPNPPARVTIAAPLPPGIDVSLSIIVHLVSHEVRNGLHVQSRSYWAPANIGPYSQAISVPVSDKSFHEQDHNNADIGHVPLEICHMAGQIPLIPSSMTLLNSNFLDQATLSLQHLWRVGQERKIDFWTLGVVFLGRQAATDTESLGTRHSALFQATVGAEIWKNLHQTASTTPNAIDEDEDDDEIDVWHLQHNRSATFYPSVSSQPPSQHLRSLPFDSGSISILPPFIAPEVSALPRDAPIEWWSTGIIGLASMKAIGTKDGLLSLQVEQTETYIRSELTITSQVKIITYMIKHYEASTSSADGFSFPFRTAKALFENGRERPEVDGFDLVNGLCYVAGDSKRNWSLFCSNSSMETPTQDQTAETVRSITAERRADRDDLLGDMSSIIPCHQLFGHGGHPDLQQAEANSPALEELDIAFVLRFDAK